MRGVPERAVIEILELHGGPCDGERRRRAPVELLSVRTPEGTTAVYRRSDEYEQVRGLGMADPCARLWSYAWVPTT